MASKRRLVSCLRRSDMEPHFVCQVCSHPGADVRPDFDWDKQPQQPRGPAVGSNLIESLAFLAAAVGNCPARGFGGPMNQQYGKQRPYGWGSLLS